MSAVPVYPVRVEGRLDDELSRWLWLVKWLLAIPHFVVLAFLWIAFFVLTGVAFFAILLTGRYPRSIFDFNLGVLRWTWRVLFYSYSALGTDRYPPFTLGEAPDYPATLTVGYPEHLSRGLVLVKWWLLALPHYLVVAIFAGTGWLAWQSDGTRWTWGGLIGLLVFVAAVVLLFRGRYPRSVFDFVLGMDRWVLRVAAYAGLMTDRYPPFRLDMGGSEPGAPAVEAPTARGGTAPVGWGAGRVALAVLGSLVTLAAAGLVAGGVAVLAIDATQRDDDGYLMSPTETRATLTWALVSERIETDLDGPDWTYFDDLVGTVQIRSRAHEPLFVGIGPAGDVSRYLSGVEHEVVDDLGDARGTVVRGAREPAPPASRSFWVATSRGAGEQTLRWNVEDGDWRVVVMKADASKGLAADMSVGAELDGLPWLGVGLLATGGVLLAAGLVLLIVGIRRPERR
jgi:hypothetical protein